MSLGTSQQQRPATTWKRAGAVELPSHGIGSRSSQPSKKPRNVADAARSNLKRLSEAQQEPETPTSLAATSTSSSSDSVSSAASPSRPREDVFQDLKKKQKGITLNPDGPPRLPGRNDFPGLSSKILGRIPDVDVRNCVIMLHDHSKAQTPLHNLALRLQKEIPESVIILLRTLHLSSSDKHGQNTTSQTGAENGGGNTGFLEGSHTLLVDVVNNSLIAKCRFPPRNIMILGHCQGGTAALAAAALWEEIEFGGVISIGGAMPAITAQISTIKAKTPVLVLSGALGNIDDTALRQIREHFTHVDFDIRRTSNDNIPEAEDIGILSDFLAHRLRGDEWTKQAVISFGKCLHNNSDAVLTSTKMAVVSEVMVPF